jgi:signal transduction histidine kinase
VAGGGQQPRGAQLVFSVPFCVAIGLRRIWPLPAVILASAGCVVALLLGAANLTNSAVTDPLAFLPFFLAYSLGAEAGLPAGLAGVVLLTAGLQAQTTGFVPIIEMITVGPWLAGRVVASRRRLTDQLAVRNAELEAEQERFARESVRYERARIARELHDIVAHCLSLMVVQASAAQRLPAGDRDGVAQALSSVAEAAAEARQEIGRLVELIGGPAAGADPEAGDGSPGLAMIEDLVRRATATGLKVSCQFGGSIDEAGPIDDAGLTAEAARTAYRVVQESLTNALKHAPGASVAVTVHASDAAVIVSVSNGPARAQSGLERSGGQYGIAAMRDRVTALGGQLRAGPDASGGWRVRAVLPLSSPGSRARPHDELAEQIPVSLVGPLPRSPGA